MSNSESTAEVFLTAFHALSSHERERVIRRLQSELLHDSARSSEANSETKSRRFDAHYLDSLIEKARSSWQSIDDPDRWLRGIRGCPDA